MGILPTQSPMRKKVKRRVRTNSSSFILLWRVTEPVRECQAVLQLAGINRFDREADCLAAHLYKLCKGCAAR